MGLKQNGQHGRWSPSFGIKTRPIIGFASLFLAAILLLTAVPTLPPAAAGPSTPEDREKLYAACLQGAEAVASQQSLGPGSPAAFCGCVRDDLKITPEGDRDAKFPAIRDYCLNRVTHAQRYPDAGIANLRGTCAQRQDIPPQVIGTYCGCYIDLLQKTVPWRDFLLLDSALNTKGPNGPDDEEKAILGKGLQVTFYCSQKAAR
jgi:hypothetical protein